MCWKPNIYELFLRFWTHTWDVWCWTPSNMWQRPNNYLSKTPCGVTPPDPFGICRVCLPWGLKGGWCCSFHEFGDTHKLHACWFVFPRVVASLRGNTSHQSRRLGRAASANLSERRALGEGSYCKPFWGVPLKIRVYARRGVCLQCGLQ